MAAAAVLVTLAGCGAKGGAARGDVHAAHTTAAAAPSTPAGTAAPSERPGGYDPARNASADIAAARRAAAADGRPVLIDFGADWCPDCVVLGRTFTRPATAKLVDHYHVVRVDVGRFDHNLDIAGRYLDLQTSGIPALVVLDAKGTVRTTTDQGQFADARSMPESQVDLFLKKWA
ncbi:thioredoxin family protein [Actinacidiphila guanduensis]|uniref:thioredoxin family protein n=1 Tax=Actinacidiphila guanduensis TaxID=310781 RepID=UPI0015A13996|nr:thioredoxin family protein [Actinacidiphila guanduensis]